MLIERASRLDPLNTRRAWFLTEHGALFLDGYRAGKRAAEEAEND